MTARSAHGRKLDEVLADGNWHALDELVDAAGPMVADGRALREAEAERARANGHTGPRTRGDRDRVVAAGRRRLIRQTLRNMATHGTVERRTIDGRLQYRKAR